MIVRQLLENELGGSRSKQTVVAEFWLEGGELRADYRGRNIRRLIEQDGVATPEGGELYPKDGRAFFDALPAGFARSTLFSVQDVQR